MGGGQEQLAGEQRHETTYGQSSNPMSNVSEVQVCLVMLAWTWITCGFSNLLQSAVPAGSLCQTRNLCSAVGAGGNPQMWMAVQWCTGLDLVTPGEQNQSLQVGEVDLAFVVTSKFSKQKRLCRLLASDQPFPEEPYLGRSPRGKGNPCQAVCVKALISLAVKS